MFDCFVCHGGEGSSDERVKFGVILGGVVSSAAFSGGGEGSGGGGGMGALQLGCGTFSLNCWSVGRGVSMAKVWLAMAFSNGLGSGLCVILAVSGGVWFLGGFLCFCIRVISLLMV